MTRSQMNFLFSTIDYNHDGKLQEKEWASFYHIFLENMNECDGNKDSVIGIEGMVECIQFTEGFTNVKELGEDIDRFANIIDKDKDEESVNIIEFVFVRRLNLAWGECASGFPELAMINVPCAMKIVVPNIIAD